MNRRGVLLLGAGLAALIFDLVQEGPEVTVREGVRSSVELVR